MQAIVIMASEFNDVHVNLHDFCDRHAKAAAVDLVTAFCSYKAFRSCDGVKTTCASYTEFAKRFTDRFLVHFENEFLKRNPVNHNDCGVSHTTSNSNEELSDLSENEVESQSPRFNQKPFFRRLSFKGLRRGKNFFRKQDSDEVELSMNEKKNDRQTKSKLAKITVECRRNGLASYLVADDGPPKWEKCRLSLSSSAGGGYILVFYCPPKVISNEHVNKIPLAEPYYLQVFVSIQRSMCSNDCVNVSGYQTEMRRFLSFNYRSQRDDGVRNA